MSGHGGARPGAGAKKIDPNLRREGKSIRLPRRLWNWIDARAENRSRFIESAVLAVQEKENE